MAFWHIVVPTGRTDRNQAINPSFELGTAGCGTIQAGTVGTTSGAQAFGAWSGSVATTTNGTAGFMGPSFTAGNGTAYTARSPQAQPSVPGWAIAAAST
jgi:hypothetical protein